METGHCAFARGALPGRNSGTLEDAHAFAYGGSAIQDLGYYPFGHAFFSDLTHYVRSGDFVRSLLRNARTPEELAFAIGALSHYIGDSVGHSVAVNPAVAVDFPKLRQRYGASIPYDKAPRAHVRTEFGFDVNEISKHRFAPSAYLEHVGLKVSSDLLARSFFETYGLQVTEVLGGTRRPTLRGYRFAVRHLLPRLAYAETVLHRKQMVPDLPGPEVAELDKALAQSDFENGWEAYRKHAGIGTHALAGLIFVLPKIGPLAPLAIKVPDQVTQQWYVQSLNASIAGIRRVLLDLQRRDPRGTIEDLPNHDLDTGLQVQPGGYRLTDETYAELLRRVTKPGAERIPAGLKDDLLAYYADPSAPISTKQNPPRWAEVQAELVLLQHARTVPEP